jgi:N-acetylmuramoyl-L-alanine amidase
MKTTLALLFLLPVVALEWSPLTLRAASAAMETADFSGHRYVRLTDWARAASFDVRWLQRDEAIQLTNRSCRLTFEKDSHNAGFNGVNVLLCYPFVVQNGAGYLAEADLRETLAPLFSPTPNAGGAHVRTIVIDPGHGGKDPGFQVGSHQEKKYTLLLAQELRDQLKHAGFNASLTRTRDTYVEKSARPEIARQRGADLFISLHWNSASVGKNDVRGVQTYCLTPAGAASSNSGDDVSDVEAKPGNRNDRQNLLLAYDLQKTLTHDLGAEDRGVRRARFAVLCDAQMPAVLIEGGYMSHPVESKQIYDSAYRRHMAGAIVAGVLAYKRQVEPPPPNTGNATNR